MGLTERHWFEGENVPENQEWDLEDAVHNSRPKADTVEVVRCKDCTFLADAGICIVGIPHGNKETFYCAYGKRRNDDG